MIRAVSYGWDRRRGPGGGAGPASGSPSPPREGGERLGDGCWRRPPRKDPGEVASRFPGATRVPASISHPCRSALWTVPTPQTPALFPRVIYFLGEGRRKRGTAIHLFCAQDKGTTPRPRLRYHGRGWTEEQGVSSFSLWQSVWERWSLGEALSRERREM